MADTPLNFFETYRSTVTAAQCDHLGHMNVQFYIAAVSDGGNVMLTKLGVSPEVIEKRRIAFAAVRMEIDYLKELREGEQIVLDSAVESVAENSIILRHRLKLAETGKEAMANKVTLLMMDMDNRKAVPIPEDIRTKIEELIGKGKV